MKNTEKVLYYCERKWQTREFYAENAGHKVIIKETDKTPIDSADNHQNEN